MGFAFLRLADLERDVDGVANALIGRAVAHERHHRALAERHGEFAHGIHGGEHVVHGVRIDDRSGDAGLLESANVFLAARCRLLREQHVGQVTGDLQ